MHGVELTDGNFDSEVLQSESPVMVGLWAPWCGPCRLMSCVLELVMPKYPGVKFANLNVDEHMDRTQKLEVRSIPTMIFFKGGQEVNRIVGAVSEARLEELLSELLAA